MSPKDSPYELTVFVSYIARFSRKMFPATFFCRIVGIKCSCLSHSLKHIQWCSQKILEGGEQDLTKSYAILHPPPSATRLHIRRYRDHTPVQLPNL